MRFGFEILCILLVNHIILSFSRLQAIGAYLTTQPSKFTISLFSMLTFLAAQSENIAFAAGVANPQRPAMVRFVGRNQTGRFAVFDQGSETGFVIARDVCFYRADGHKVFCAPIVRTKLAAAAVTFKDNLKGDIVKGLYVWPQDLGEINLAALSESVASVTSSDAQDLLDEEDDPPEPELPPLLARRLQVHLAPTLFLPIWMNDLRFNAGARSAGTGKIWESGDTIRGSAIGFGMRYHLPKNGAGDSAFDFTYHFVAQNPVKDDFDLTDGSTNVQSSVWSHHCRFRWLRGATWMHDDASDLLLYTGFGYDLLMAKFSAGKTGGASGNLVSGTITGHGFEIPVVVAWQKYFGDWMVTTGVDMALPLGVFGVQSKGKLSYDENTGNADKSLGNAVDAVNVRRGWFSFALQFGLGAKF